MVDNIAKHECTGCKMCGDICPVQAISFETDKEGFWYPVIDKEKCTECNLCELKCPSLNQVCASENKLPDVYAVWSKNEETRITSTSGGAFWEFATFFIENGGYVAGCAYSADFKSAFQMIAHDLEELKKIKGSKYFQSDSENIYKEVKSALLENKKVLFCGTPCQNAAMRSFLGKDFENLYYMDFICRSINSPLAFSKYLSELEEQYGSDVVEVQLKNKNKGWQSLASRVKFANGKESVKDKNEDWWVKGFLANDLYTRDSCFHCKYKVLPRSVADITIGDFWGIKNQSDMDMFKGISVLLLNSDKGKQLFESIKEKLIVQKHNLQEVIPGNPALKRNPTSTGKQDLFFSLINEGVPFSLAVKKCTKTSVVKKVWRKLLLIVKKINIVKHCFVDGGVSIPKFIYYNYFCKNIIRKDRSKIIPYKGAILNFAKGAKIILSGRNLEIGHNKLKGSRSETHIRMDENAVWNCSNGAMLFYNTIIEIKENAVFNTGFFSANGGSVIIVDKEICFGEDVMIGRNVIIYDSDFHQLKDETGKQINPARPVFIEDHVWLTSNITVLKGVTIGRDSLVSAQTVINKSMPEHSIIAGKSNGHVIKDSVIWDRARCERE